MIYQDIYNCICKKSDKSDEYSIKHQSNNKSWKFGLSRGRYNPLYSHNITIIPMVVSHISVKGKVVEWVWVVWVLWGQSELQVVQFNNTRTKRILVFDVSR